MPLAMLQRSNCTCWRWRVNWHAARLRSMIWMHRGSRSTNVTCLAPRLSASMPMLPVPAHKSRKFASTTCSRRMLNTDSLTLSAVGRTAFPLGAAKRLPLNLPAIILIFCHREGIKTGGFSYKGGLTSFVVVTLIVNFNVNCFFCQENRSHRIYKISKIRGRRL